MFSQNRRGEEDFGDPIESKAIKAGRRTYFIDVRATRDDDYFLTITESRKKHTLMVAQHLIVIKYSFTRRISRSLKRGCLRLSTL